MFYAENLRIETVVEAMAEVQARIQERLPIQIGMCVHAGSFYEIGGGLYGGDADTVEYLAEHCAEPGEIVVTGTVAQRLNAAGPGGGPIPGVTLQRLELEGLSEQPYAVEWSQRAPWLRENETAYPHAYPPEFYELLRQSGGSEEQRRRIYDQWLKECTIVFLARERVPGGERALDGMLDDLVINALMDTLVRETMAAGEHIAASTGGLAILTFDTPQEAIGFARDVRAKLTENGLPVQLAIDAGPVLLFRNSRGPSGITGDPVNIASKLAEDLGVSGSISVTERAFSGMSGITGADRFELTVSGIPLRGVFLS
jgi:class 3 adenylate cyclase